MNRFVYLPLMKEWLIHRSVGMNKVQFSGSESKATCAIDAIVKDSKGPGKLSPGPHCNTKTLLVSKNPKGLAERNPA